MSGYIGRACDNTAKMLMQLLLKTHLNDVSQFLLIHLEQRKLYL